VTAPFRPEPLDDHHDRSGFSCGDEALDRYFKTQVTQDIRRRLSNCFVAVECETEIVAGFYTLASAGIPMTDLPPEMTKRLPRYASVPAVRIGRLAVDLRFRRKGLGGALLINAASRVFSSDAATYALLVDAKNDQAVAFYEHHGFERFVSQPRTLFLALATAEKSLHTPKGRR
jgi:ribosomal protein S18 acetylase RimI-like enzyme